MEEKNLDISKLWLIFRRRKWFFIIPLAVFTVLGILIAFGLPKVYEAKCILLVEKSRVVTGIFEDEQKNTLGDAKNLVKTVQEMVLGWGPVTSTLRQTGLITETEFNNASSRVEELYNDITNRVKFSTKSDKLIEVSFQDKQPFLAYKVMDGLVSNFMERFLSLGRSQVDSTLNFIERDLKRLREKLDESEENLRAFEEKHFAQLPEAEKSNLAKHNSLKDELAQINLEITIQKDKLDLIDQSLKQEDSTILGEVIKIPNPKVVEINKRIDELDSALASMQAKYYDTHPAIISVKKELESLTNKLKEEEEKVVGAEKTVNNPVHEQMVAKKYDEMMKLRALELRKKEAEAAIANMETSVKTIPSLKKELTELRRNYDVMKSLYNERLAQKSKEELRREMSMYAAASPYTIIEAPRIPQEPVKSTRIKVLIIAIFLGLAIGIGLVFLTEQLDQRFKDVEDAGEFLQIPLLGVVPTIHLAEDLLRNRRKKLKTLIVIGSASGAAVLLLSILIFIITPSIVEKGLDAIQRIVG